MTELVKGQCEHCGLDYTLEVSKPDYIVTCPHCKKQSGNWDTSSNPMTCKNSNHYMDMIVFGACPSCKKEIPQHKEDEMDDTGVSFEPERAAVEYEASREEYYTSN